MSCPARRPFGRELPTLAGCALAGWPQRALSHAAASPPGGAQAIAWSFDVSVVALLALSIAFYAAGALRLHPHSRLGRRMRGLQAAAFAAGWLVVVAALVSPLDALGASLFSAHMLQHELLMIVAAPLLVLGRPLSVWLWAFPAPARQRIARMVRAPAFSATWTGLTRPGVVWVLHAAALWAWHAPALFESALHHPRVHTAQHWSFLVTALLFWWTALGHGRASSTRSAHGLLLLFTTMMHTSALGALLTLAPGVWYPSYIASSTALGFDPLEDQQLGGLVMWVPGALAYVLGGLAVAARWLMQREPPGRAGRLLARQP